MYPSDVCPIYAPFFGALGCCCAVSLCVFGAAYGTAKSGIGIMAAGILRPDRMIPNTMPVIMAGILAVYGLVVSVMIANLLKVEMHIFTAFMMLGAGLSVGMAGLAAGFAIGIVGDAGVRGSSQQPRLFVGMMLLLILSEVLGIYGMIVAVLMLSTTSTATC